MYPEQAAVPTPAGSPARTGPGEGCLAIFERTPDAMFIVDDGRRILEVNAAARALLLLPGSSLVGRCIHDFFPPPARADTQPYECPLRHGEETRHVSCHVCADIRPGQHLYVARDVTGWRRAEDAVHRAEQLYRTLVETTDTGYFITDARGGVLDANAEYVHLSGHIALEEIRGRHPLEWLAPDDRARFSEAIERCFAYHSPVRDLEIALLDVHGRIRPVEFNATAITTPDGPRLLCLCHDITHRIQVRRDLEDARHDLECRVERRTAELARANEQIRSRARQQESVADLGRRALAGADLDELMREAVETVCAVLDVEQSTVVEHADPDSNELLLRAAHGWRGESQIGQPVASTDPAFLAGFALSSPAPVVSEDLRAEQRFRPTPGLAESGFVSGMTVPIGGDPQPFGLISAHSLQPRRFTPDDIYFLQSMANVLAAATDRKRSEETVRLAQQAAVQANNAKIEFLSRMSHELRTPLNAILGFSQLLQIERLDAGQRESVEQITRAGRHLLELVNEVLDISRIDSGHLGLTPEPLSVDELVREALDLIRPLAIANGISLGVEAGVTAPGQFVLADRQRLRQVLLNLLSNAVKYNRAGGHVTLGGGLSPNGKRVRLRVVDTGQGIAAEQLPRLFTPFERLGAEKTNVEGSGIGLALAKRLVEGQRGELGVTSEPGVGTTFWVDLPVAAAPLADTAPSPLDALFEDGLMTLEPEDDVPEEPPASRTVLHIEDNEPNRLLVEMLMRQRPAWRLLTAARGLEGLSMAWEHQPDLILLDMHLPDTTGETVLQKLRGKEETRQTPVVMVSADAAAMRRNEERATGANSYLTKPFNVSDFLKLMDRYLLSDAV